MTWFNTEGIGIAYDSIDMDIVRFYNESPNSATTTASQSYMQEVALNQRDTNGAVSETLYTQGTTKSLHIIKFTSPIARNQNPPKSEKITVIGDGSWLSLYDHAPSDNSLLVKSSFNPAQYNYIFTCSFGYHQTQNFKNGSATLTPDFINVMGVNAPGAVWNRTSLMGFSTSILTRPLGICNITNPDTGNLTSAGSIYNTVLVDNGIIFSFTYDEIVSALAGYNYFGLLLNMQVLLGNVGSTNTLTIDKVQLEIKRIKK